METRHTPIQASRQMCGIYVGLFIDSFVNQTLLCHIHDITYLSYISAIDSIILCSEQLYLTGTIINEYVMICSDANQFGVKMYSIALRDTKHV